ncbi:MAG TPA: DUF3987 domain-containing protein [Acidimicrobiales bacterium]|nr:DUF3987 domain-containing protein [Acidimicrobiales bacterium]
MDDLVLGAPPGFPGPPDPTVFSGLAGAIAEQVAPETEADPLAVLTQLLVSAGALIGRGAFFQIEATRHHSNEFVVLVGDSAKARKGSSWDRVAELLGRVGAGFAALVHTGLSTGEGLIFAARDGEGDNVSAKQRRLLVIEPEFVSVLKAVGRELSSLSPVLRAAWDGRPLALLTRSAPVRASAAHICLIGHITRSELAAHLGGTQAMNGFLNRFVFIACRRQRLLPEGGSLDPLAGTGLEAVLRDNLQTARRAGQLCLDEQARRDWREIYLELALTEHDDELIGALLARAEAHVLRLAMLYALIDGRSEICTHDLSAGRSLFDYAAASLAWARRQAVADPLAERIVTELSKRPEGLTRTAVRDLFARNVSAERIEEALGALQRDGRAACRRSPTGGRPAECWFAGSAER